MLVFHIHNLTSCLRPPPSPLHVTMPFCASSLGWVHWSTLWTVPGVWYALSIILYRAAEQVKWGLTSRRKYRRSCKDLEIRGMQNQRCFSQGIMECTSPDLNSTIN